MFIEVTQLSYDQQRNVWDDIMTSLMASAVVGFYPHPEYEGTTVILLADQEPMLVRESYLVIKGLLTPPKKEKEIKVKERQPEPNVWIPADEHQPIRDGSYLVTTNRLSYGVEMGIFKDGKWRIPGVKVIAWMEVPRPSWYRCYLD